MPAYKRLFDPATGEEYITTSLSGKNLLQTTLLNKGTAFTNEERHAFGLLGKLPMRVESLDEQAARAYWQFSRYTIDLSKNIYLNNLQDRNEVLFYRLVSDNIGEMLPLIYTPIVGTAVKEFSREFRQPRGLYLSYTDRDNMEEVLRNRSHEVIKLIVVTDGGGVLGIGDQGVGAMDIPIAKLMVYSLCGAIYPGYTLSLMLDVGTNNEELLADPMYLGWRHERIEGPAYDSFIEQFVETVKKMFPQVFLHWEDFAFANARRILEKYQHELCTFNDDIQGTGAVALAGVLAGVHAKGETLAQQRIVIFGAGTAGLGIADQLCSALVRQGCSVAEARQRIWLIDKAGLLVAGMPDLSAAQQRLARSSSDISDWHLEQKHIGLDAVVTHVKPTILIGCSAVTGAFTEAIVRYMAQHVARPIIFPLSNPTERAEATPQNLLRWTEGRAIVATGSPFGGVAWDNKTLHIPQSNNALVFPGIGLGAIAAKAKYVTDDMIWAACEALGRAAPIYKDPFAPVLPALSESKQICKQVALAVAQAAVDAGVAGIAAGEDLQTRIAHLSWEPHYVRMVKQDV